MLGVLSLVVVVAALAIAYFHGSLNYGTSSAPSSLNTCPSNFQSRLIKSFSLDRENDEIAFECFFSSDFYKAQALFLHSAEKANAHIETLPVIEGNNKISTHVAVIPGNPHRFLVHISGTHGPEGYAGSAIQSAALQYISESPEFMSDKENVPTVVFVHALNPYGFANNRRVNEDNIDLNRNFLNEQRFKDVMSRDPNFAGYVDIDETINPTVKPFPFLILNEMYAIYAVLKSTLIHGQHKLKKGLVSGNYFKQIGLGFGGFKLSKSAQNLIELMERLNINADAEKVVLLDVHSGLGPSGVDTLMIDLKDYTDNERKEIRNSFPLDKNSTTNNVIGGILEDFHGTAQGQGASAGYELTVGTVTEDFCKEYLAPRLNKHSKICLTQEFGSIPMMLVGKNLVDENYAFHHGTKEEKILYGNRLKHSFYVDTDPWKRNVLRRGLGLFLQGFEYLKK